MEVTSPTVLWARQTIAPDVTQNHIHALHLVYVLIAAPSRKLGPKVHMQYPNAISSKSIQDEIKSSQAVAYIHDQLAKLSDDPDSVRLLTFVLPYTSGYIVRSDFLSIRLQMLQVQRNSEVQSFSKPLQYCAFEGLSQTSNNLSGMLDTAVGVIFSKIGQNFYLEHTERELLGRLSYPWLSTQPIPERRVALVRGRPNYRVGRPVYSAAKALGVSLVIIDEDKHWLQADNTQNNQLREAFLTIDMSEDQSLPYRIANAITTYPATIDGIFTLSDNYLVAVARAAEIVGLPTCPSSAYEAAFDKEITRSLHAASHEYANAKSEDDLASLFTSGKFSPQYPLIVKPRTGGWNSQYVQKARDKEELFLAVRKICPKYKDGVIIEPYYDGPEIDANMVMSDGKVLFQEIVDEPPSEGDLANHTSANFLENGMRAPSILPQKEQQSIFNAISKDLLALGFTDGVFHVEARISRSSMELRSDNGSIDLVPTSPNPSDDVQYHLIEINARPPGLRAQILTQIAYGIDYFAGRILSAINDLERTKAICYPFTLPGFPSGSQSWCQLVHLPVLCKGTAAGVVAIDALLTQLPDVAVHVAEYQCCFEPGEALPDPSEYVDVYGHCVISSTRGRRHVISIADTILEFYHAHGAKTTVLAPCDQNPTQSEVMCDVSSGLDRRIATAQNSKWYNLLGK
ncbi:unnamed protein product [Periconia digitata]|uniref:ATP-grasp domain-containing protein n=1 Tax=Periconia digitata TaxID=1303443 RepID=A0A9W4UC52_9PLEO|nr:unnamed protein product [Periconia digitata]